MLSTGSQGVVLLTWFLIYAPRDQMAWLSWTIWMFGLSGSSAGCSLHVVLTLFLCARDPIGMISVFIVLNFAPDAEHHVSRMPFRSLYRSFIPRYMVVSSAKRLMSTFSFTFGIVYPCSLGDSLTTQARGSMARSNVNEEMGSPCLIP